jgi:hypothetical protein
MVFTAINNLTEPVAVTITEMGSAFINAAKYLTELPEEPDEKYIDMTLDERLEDTAKYWGRKFGMNVTYDKNTRDFIFVFKNKSAYMLFLMEWS